MSGGTKAVEWTEERINAIIALKGDNRNPIDVFNLYGILFVGTTQEEPFWDLKRGKTYYRRGWDLSKRFTAYAQHSISFHLDDFEFCETEDDVREVFSEGIKRAVTERVL